MFNTHLAKLMEKEMTRREFLVLTAFGVASIFGVIGVINELKSRAATATASVEPENGTIASPAAMVVDSTASNGKKVKFGSGTPTGMQTQPIWRDEFNTLSISDGGTRRNWLPSEQGVNDNGHVGGGSKSWEWTPHGGPAALNIWSVSNSVLTMKCIKNPGGQYAGGQLITEPWIGGTMTTDPATGGAWTYGYFEFRARLPVHGKGMFPALWMYKSVGSNGHDAAEFDLMEIFGHDGQPWNTTIHGPANESIDGGYAGYYSDTAGWHRYGIDWQPNYLRFYRDGSQYAERTGYLATWFQGAVMGIRMDYAANPNWDSSLWSDGSTPSTLYMEVDYVRVYKNKPADLPTGTGDPYTG